VGTDVGGIPYMVEHGVTGVVCAADGALALADALQDSAAQTDAIKRMRQAARHKAVNDFSWASVGRALHHTIMARIDTLPPVGTGPSTDGRRP